MLVSRGSMTTVPMEYEPSPSNTGEKVTPELSVFQTPLEADPTKYCDRFLGFTAIETTRPETNAGPMERSLSPPNVPLDIGSLGFSSAAFSPAFALSCPVSLAG